MPLLHISMRAGKPDAYRQAILDGLYRAMREALDVPEGDAFMTISELSSANFRCGNAYGVNRSDDAVLIQITVFASRTPDQKKALYRRIAELLGQNPGIRPEDVFTICSMPRRRTGPSATASRNSREFAGPPNTLLRIAGGKGLIGCGVNIRRAEPGT